MQIYDAEASMKSSLKTEFETFILMIANSNSICEKVLSKWSGRVKKKLSYKKENLFVRIHNIQVSGFASYTFINYASSVGKNLQKSFDKTKSENNFSYFLDTRPHIPHSYEVHHIRKLIFESTYQ